MSEDNVEAVRSLWRAFGRGGMEAVLRIADPDVEWIPYGGAGRVYRGHDGLSEFLRRGRSEQRVAEPYSYADLGNHVLVYGHYQPAGGDDERVFWLYSFRDGRLVRFEAFRDQSDALRAAGSG